MKRLTFLFVATTLVSLSSMASAQLIGHYALDDITAGTTTDSTGINGPGVLSGGPTLSAGAGKIGSAFSFAGGTGEFVGVSDAGFGQTNFTASVWFNPNSVTSQGPLSNWTNANPSPRTFLIRSSSGGDLQTFVRSGGSQIGGTVAFPTETLTATDFNLATITYDGQTLRTYLNGELSTTTASFGSPSVLGEGVQGTAGIGGRGSSELDFAGLIDDTAFWGETLTDGKARAIFTLADETALNYDASEADLLFQVFDGDIPGVVIDDLVWRPAMGLGGAQGDVVDLGSGSFFLNVDGTAGVAAQLVPEPASIAIWTLLGAVGVLWYWRRRRAVA